MSSFLNVLGQVASILANSGSSSTGKGCKLRLSCAGDSLTFPINPPSFEVVNPYNNSSVNINAIGDINMLGKRGLTTIKFSSFFPAQMYSFVPSSVEPPYTYVEKIKSFAEKGQPSKLSISNTNISMNVSIDEFDYDEHDGSNDVYFSLSLREYRYVLPDSNKLDDTTELGSRVAEELEEKVITVYPGMDLMDIASQCTGQLFDIDNSTKNTLRVFSQMAKLGHLDIGTILSATKQRVKIDKTTVIEF